MRLNMDLTASHSHFATYGDLVFPAFSRLQIRCNAPYPEGRAGEAYEITLCGRSSSRTRLALKDIHMHDEHRVPMYRKDRGREFPVYKVPSELSTLERRREDKVWQAWIIHEPRLVSDMPLLTRLFLAITK